MSNDDGEFRKYAAQCMAYAKSAMDDTSRASWVEMAQNWLRLAEKTEARLVVQQQQQQQPPKSEKGE